MTNETVLLSALSNGGTVRPDFQPQNNKQAYLAYLNGLDISLPEPRTVEEELLYNLCLNGGAGGGGGSQDAVVFTQRTSDGHPLAVDASGLSVLHTSQFYSGRSDCPFSTVKTFKLPNGLTEFPAYVFAYCTGMESITIPEGVTSIGEGAFIGCTSLKNVVIPSTVTEIAKKAFYDCKALESITIPSGVTAINSQVFQGCLALKSLTIPASVTMVDSQFVRSCDLLTSVIFEGKPSSISTLAFMGSSVTDIYVPWSDGEVAGAPWNSTATIHYNQ